ncbi:MAG: monovalent cation/H+ antiporter complex subunit F [Dehalococcoidia bacterium]
MNIFLTGTAIFVVVNAFICLYRAIKGPTIQDRLLTLAIVGSSMLAVLVLLASIFKSSIYLDVAMLFVLLNFIVMIVVSRYLETYDKEVNRSDR